MAITFPTFEECTVSNGVKMLVYAPAGHGKTMLAATMPEPILMVSTENGMRSLSPANQMRVFRRVATIQPVKIDTIKDLCELADSLEKSSDYEAFPSVALDSASDIAQVVLNKALAKASDPRQAYGKLQEEISTVFRRFRDLPKQHVLFICHMEKEKEEATGRLLFGPSMPGTKLSQQIPHFFDEVFHLTVFTDEKTKQKSRWLLCQPDGIKFQAKDRSGALDEYEPANLTEVINKIQSHE